MIHEQAQSARRPALGKRSPRPFLGSGTSSCLPVPEERRGFAAGLSASWEEGVSWHGGICHTSSPSLCANGDPTSFMTSRCPYDESGHVLDHVRAHLWARAR